MKNIWQPRSVFYNLTEHKKMTNKTIDINEFIIRKYVESLRSENIDIREQIDIGYSYDGKIVIPHYRANPFV